PNYLAATGGSTFGVTTDCTTCFQAQPNIAVDRVEASGRSWKAYMESMPSPCFVGDSGTYAQKHDPFIYYDDIRLNSTECNKVVPYASFASDLASTATTPNYAWVTPNLCDDMHDCSISTGDTWLSQNVPTILNSPAFTTQNSLLAITWDEDDGTQNNQVPTLVIAKSVPAGFRSSTHYNHYSLLATIESAWGLSPLTTNDASATPMSDFFNSTQSAPAFTADSPPTTANVGAPYSYTFQASGNPAPTFAVASGALPTGLSLAAGTGVLSGTPTTTGSYTFTVSASNGVGSPAVTPPITITVSAPTVPGAPTGVSAVANRKASATVSWTAPTSDGRRDRRAGRDPRRARSCVPALRPRVPAHRREPRRQHGSSATLRHPRSTRWRTATGWPPRTRGSPIPASPTTWRCSADPRSASAATTPTSSPVKPSRRRTSCRRWSRPG